MAPTLRARPDLEHLKKQAKALLHDYQQQDPAAIERFRSLGNPVLHRREGEAEPSPHLHPAMQPVLRRLPLGER